MNEYKKHIEQHLAVRLILSLVYLIMKCITRRPGSTKGINITQNLKRVLYVICVSYIRIKCGLATYSHHFRFIGSLTCTFSFSP